MLAPPAAATRPPSDYAATLGPAQQPRMAATPPFSVIPTYGRPGYLARRLEALAALEFERERLEP